MNSLESQPRESEKNIALVEQIAKTTWNSIDLMVNDETGLPYDRIEFNDLGMQKKGPTSPANIGLFLAAALSARDLRLPHTQNTSDRISRLLDTLTSIPEGAGKHCGLFYNWLQVEDARVATTWKDGTPIEPFLSSVDNAILVGGLIATEGAFPEFSDRIDELIKRMEFAKFYDPNLNLVHGRIDLTQDGELKSPWHYDVYNTDGRIAAYIGTSIFDLPDEVLLKMGLETPTYTTNQVTPQTPSLKSWNGTLFEAGLPNLILPERHWSDATYAAALDGYFKAQETYGEQHLNGWWGYSSCYLPDGSYAELGDPEIAMNPHVKPPQYITPHAIALGLQTGQVNSSINLLSRLVDMGYLDEQYGFPDSISVSTDSYERASTRCLIDQVMTLISTANYVDKSTQVSDGYGGIHRYTGPRLEQKLKPVMQKESFYFSNHLSTSSAAPTPIPAAVMA